MFRLILLAGIIYFLLKWLRRSTAAAPAPRSGQPAAEQKVEEMVQDPVCGTWVPAGQAIIMNEGRERRFFCSPECRDKYLGKGTNGQP